MVDIVNKCTIVSGDYGSYIQFNLYDSDEDAYTLATATTIQFHLKKYGESTLTVDGGCSTTGVLGQCRYLIASLDTRRIGDYIGDIEVTESGVITTWTPIYVKIIEEVG